MSRRLIAEGNRQCTACGETKERLSRHWSYCQFPSVDADCRSLLTGILLGGGSLQGNGEQTQHLRVSTTSEDLARWLLDELGWLAHSLRRVTSEDNRKPLYIVRTHSHTHLRRLRDRWYRGGDKRLRSDVDLSPRAARVWWALAGGLEWTGAYDSQIRGTLSAEADERADAIMTVLSAAGYDADRLDRRVCLYGDDIRDWLAWISPPVPGVEHKWTTSLVEYRARNAGPGIDRDLKRAKVALELARERTGQQLTPDRFNSVVDAIDADTVADLLGDGSWGDALGVAAELMNKDRNTDRDGEWGKDPNEEGSPYMGRKISLIDRDRALRSAASHIGEPLHRDDYNQWRENVDWTPPSGDGIDGRWGWSDAVTAVGLQPGKQYGRDLSDAIDAVTRLRNELGDWPTVTDYREHKRPGDPALSWLYEQKPGGVGSWPDLIDAAQKRER